MFGDDRGYFMETYNRQVFMTPGCDVWDNSPCQKGVLRGLHLQMQFSQGNWCVISGEVYDVGVVTRGSPTYGKYYGTILSVRIKRCCIS